MWLFFLCLHPRFFRTLALGGCNESKCYRARLSIRHGIDENLFQDQTRMTLRTDAYEFLQVLKGNNLLFVIRSIRTDKDGLTDRISWSVHDQSCCRRT